MHKPTLSVILPNFNHSRYVGNALKAILNQSFRPLEVIVVDDGSTDESIRIIQEFAARDTIVKLVCNDTNRGVIFSANRALQIVSGDYVYMTAADDKVLPGFFEKSMNLLTKYPQAGLCCSWPASFNSTTQVFHKNKIQWSETPRYFSPEELAEVIQGGYIPGHTSIIKRSALLEAGGFIPELKWHSDWFLVHVIAFRYGICYIPEPLAAIRISAETYSASGRRDWSQQSQVLHQLLKILKSPAYRAVLPYFIRGSLMSHFGDEIVRVVMSHPEHWDMETLILIQEPLWNWNQKLKQNRDKRALEERIQSTFEQGNSAIERGDLDEALTIFYKLTQESPHLIQGYTSVATVANALGRYPVACDALSKAIRLSPNDPELYNRLGVTHYRTGDQIRAERAFQQALSLDPTHLNAHMNIAEIACHQGRYEEAGQLYLEALKDHPQNIDLWMACGRYALVVNRLDLAKAAFQRVLELDPDLEEAREALQRLGSENSEIHPVEVSEPVLTPMRTEHS